MHVLIGIDGSEDARAAAVRAVSLLAPADVVTLVSVGEPPAEMSAGLESGFAGGVADPDEVTIAWEAVGEAATRVLETTRDVIAPSLPAGTRVDLRVEYGAPGPDLCRIAAEIGADVLAVGSRGQGAIRRALLGSVSSHVVHNAPCAVMVIRARDRLTTLEVGVHRPARVAAAIPAAGRDAGGLRPRAGPRRGRPRWPR